MGTDAAILDVNVDMGESYGRWRLGDDAGMMPHVSSVNIACGFHAGDPATLRETVARAVEHGLQIGAHISLPDVLGFGRRRMAISPEELEDYALYQIGALQAFATAAGGRVEHVKPHGALYVMCWESPELAEAVARAQRTLGAGDLLYAFDMRQRDVAARHGVRLVQEAFVDLWYDGEGHLLLERAKLHTDPELAARRAIRLAREHRLETRDGNDIEIAPRTICLHGDGPNGVEVAETVRRRLNEAGIELRPVRDDDGPA
jgi:5-oxoprolinase (ATP-hydrolysing) subunit A